MSTFYQRGADKRRTLQEMRLKEKEVGSCPTGPASPKQGMEQEKRLRREIANSNERRRMQSINAGFQSLKTMIPHHEGEKLSKAAILQHTADYICQLEHIRSQLVAENNELKQLVQGLGNGQNSVSPPPKRKKRDTESSDEGIVMTCNDAEEHSIENYKRELLELRSQLEQERKHRMLLERRLLATSSTRDDAPKCKTEVPAQPWLKGGSDVEESQQVPRPTLSLSPPSPPLAATSVQPSPFLHSVNPSLSRRNLDTIVEAIRHLEGEQALVDSHDSESERSVPASCACIPHSEESGTESSYDQEDCFSENLSPRCDSQSSSASAASRSTSQMDCEISTPTSTTFTASPTVHAAPHSSLLHHQGTSLLSHSIPDIHCSTYTASAAYQLPLQLLTHAAAVATAKPQQPHPSVVVMQKS